MHKSAVPKKFRNYTYLRACLAELYIDWLQLRPNAKYTSDHELFRLSAHKAALYAAWSQGDVRKIERVVLRTPRQFLLPLLEIVTTGVECRTCDLEILAITMATLVKRMEAQKGVSSLIVFDYMELAKWDTQRLMTACEATMANTGWTVSMSALLSTLAFEHSGAEPLLNFSVLKAALTAAQARFEYRFGDALAKLCDNSWGSGAGALMRVACAGSDAQAMTVANVLEAAAPAKGLFEHLAVTWDGNTATLVETATKLAALPKFGIELASQILSPGTKVSIEDFSSVANMLSQK